MIHHECCEFVDAFFDVYDVFFDVFDVFFYVFHLSFELLFVVYNLFFHEDELFFILVLHRVGSFCHIEFRRMNISITERDQ